MAKAVFVLGAGASCEVGLPTGEGLKKEIGEVLHHRVEGGTVAKADPAIYDAFSAVLKERGARDRNPLLRASRAITTALPSAYSIDNLLDARQEDADIVLCGKLAIARCILRAEKVSKLAEGRNGSVNLQDVSGTWFKQIFNRLTEGCRLEQLGARFSKVAAIIFNYDRCFEHYMYHALQQYYGCHATTAASLVAAIETHHPYGKVGRLPWMAVGTAPGTEPGIHMEYGGEVEGATLLASAKQLKTFTEGVESERAETIRDCLAAAERVVFLGYAFHDLNQRLLYRETRSPTRSNATVLATTFRVSPINIAAHRSELLLAGGYRDNQVYFADETCGAFVASHSKLLSFR